MSPPAAAAFKGGKTTKAAGAERRVCPFDAARKHGKMPRTHRLCVHSWKGKKRREEKPAFLGPFGDKRGCGTGESEAGTEGLIAFCFPVSLHFSLRLPPPLVVLQTLARLPFLFSFASWVAAGRQ